jgi:PBP1b-binding outer membrane lipoprotein LpoB
LLLALNACATSETSAPLETSPERSGRWNEMDARLTAEAMIKEAQEAPWVQRFTRAMGRTPVVMVGAVLNRTSEELRTEIFSAELQQAVKRSGRMQAGQDPAADFILQGTIQTPADERNSPQTVVYQVDLELVDAASNVKVWGGQKTIHKRL